MVYVDMVGYSRLIGLDDAGTLARLNRLRAEVIDVAVRSRGGTIRQTAGDSLLITFDSITEAVSCAVTIQQGIPEVDRDAPAGRRMRFRVGIHMGDAIADGSDLHGDSVNIAVRLQSVARPGSICVSRAVHDHIRDRIGHTFQPLGALSLKNIARPVEAFLLQVTAEGGDPAVPASPAQSNLHSPELLADAGTASHRPAIAMLPLRDVGQDAVGGYFCEGLMHEVVASLATFRELFVVSSSSTLALPPDATRSQDRAGHALGVRYVVTGTVARHGERIRVAVELTDTESRSIVWSDRYETSERDMVVAQDAAARRIAYSLLPHLRHSELRRAVRKPPSSQNAYDLVLQAQHSMCRLGNVDRRRARELLLRAVRRDRTYAMAYALLSHWHVFQVAESRTSDLGGDERAALEYSALALEHDPFDALALAIHGHAQAYLFHRLHDAIETFDRATIVSPNSPIAWAMSSPTYGYQGDGAAAVRRAEYALRLSPLDPYAHIFHGRLGFAHYINGTFSEAIQWDRRSLAKEPNFLGVLRHYTGSLVALGLLDDARAAAARILALRPGFSVSQFIQHYPIADPELSRQYADRLIRAGLPE